MYNHLSISISKLRIRRPTVTVAYPSKARVTDNDAGVDESNHEVQLIYRSVSPSMAILFQCI